MDQEKMIFSCNGLQFSENEEKPNIIKIEGYAAHFNKANGNAEIVTKNSFKKFLDLMNEKGVKPLLTFDHQSQNIIGGWDNLEIREEGLYAVGHINADVALVRDTILPLMKSGDLNGLSTEGWSSMRENKFSDDGTMEIANFFLYAISLVGFPADYEAKANLKNKRKPKKKEGFSDIIIHLI